MIIKIIKTAIINPIINGAAKLNIFAIFFPTLFFSFITLGGFPLCLSIFIFLTHGIYKSLRLIEANLPIYFFCGLIAIITESFLWDAYDSVFFWITISYALTFSEDRSIPEEGSRAIT